MINFIFQTSWLRFDWIKANMVVGHSKEYFESFRDPESAERLAFNNDFIDTQNRIREYAAAIDVSMLYFGNDHSKLEEALISKNLAESYDRVSPENLVKYTMLRDLIKKANILIGGTGELVTFGK